MADQSSAAHLYSSVTKLTYTETQQAIHPRPPFAIADRNDLVRQAKKVADCAATFRQKDASRVTQSQLFNAQGLVTTAQTMFDVINSTVSSSLTKSEVYKAVDDAVTVVNAL
ncbi:hypothetical protein [Pseudorhodoferax sp. Leaf267]|uniref:hypothetical protein n=1 Tax=Pseudorhodoferax sp. Leaf267 TaxID=1736316 RepID=UPI0006F81F66|nr:hypothetical protein [Pseudorhodoferax sp. Leaf267]